MQDFLTGRFDQALLVMFQGAGAAQVFAKMACPWVMHVVHVTGKIVVLMEIPSDKNRKIDDSSGFHVPLKKGSI